MKLPLSALAGIPYFRLCQRTIAIGLVFCLVSGSVQASPLSSQPLSLPHQTAATFESQALAAALVVSPRKVALALEGLKSSLTQAAGAYAMGYAGSTFQDTVTLARQAQEDSGTITPLAIFALTVSAVTAIVVIIHLMRGGAGYSARVRTRPVQEFAGLPHGTHGWPAHDRLHSGAQFSKVFAEIAARLSLAGMTLIQRPDGRFDFRAALRTGDGLVTAETAPNGRTLLRVDRSGILKDVQLRLEPDGIIVLIHPDLSGFEHPGRSGIVMAGNEATARHELRELRYTALWAVTQGIATKGDVEAGNLGLMIRRWLNDSDKGPFLRLLRYPLRKLRQFRYFSIVAPKGHAQGLLAERKGGSAVPDGYEKAEIKFGGFPSPLRTLSPREQAILARGVDFAIRAQGTRAQRAGLSVHRELMYVLNDLSISMEGMVFNASELAVIKAMREQKQVPTAEKLSGAELNHNSVPGFQRNILRTIKRRYGIPEDIDAWAAAASSRWPSAEKPAPRPIANLAQLPIRDLNLSDKVFRSLKARGMNIVGQLMAFRRSELEKSKNLAPHLEEIEKKLTDAGGDWMPEDSPGILGKAAHALIGFALAARQAAEQTAPASDQSARLTTLRHALTFLTGVVIAALLFVPQQSLGALRRGFPRTVLSLLRRDTAPASAAASPDPALSTPPSSLTPKEKFFIRNDGVDFVASVGALNQLGVFSLLTRTSDLTTEDILRYWEKRGIHGNRGYLDVQLEVLADQGWITRRNPSWARALRLQRFRYGLTEAGRAAARPEVLRAFDESARFVRANLSTVEALEEFFLGTRPVGFFGETYDFDEFVQHAKQEWGLPDDLPQPLRERFLHQLTSPLLLPAAFHLKGKRNGGRDRKSVFDLLGSEQPLTLAAARIALAGQMSTHERPVEASQIDASRLTSVFQILEHVGWISRVDAGFSLTAEGKGGAKSALNTGVPISYLPMLSKVEILLTGTREEIERKVFARTITDGVRAETHVARRINVVGSGAAHEQYFKLMMEHVKEIFDGPIEGQPQFLLDVGCGDGEFLRMAYEYILTSTERGKLIRQDPEKYRLWIIGADYNPVAQIETTKKLSRGVRITVDGEEQTFEIPYRVIFGDINEPDAIAEAVRGLGLGLDPINGVYTSTFLIHNRPMTEIKGQPARRSLGVSMYVSDIEPWVGQGYKIPNNVVEQNLVEHFLKWKPYWVRYGLITSELFSVPPKIALANLGAFAAASYHETHHNSLQYIIEVPVFISAALRAGLLVVRKTLLPKDDEGYAPTGVFYLKAAPPSSRNSRLLPGAA